MRGLRGAVGVNNKRRQTLLCMMSKEIFIHFMSQISAVSALPAAVPLIVRVTKVVTACSAQHHAASEKAGENDPTEQSGSAASHCLVYLPSLISRLALPAGGDLYMIFYICQEMLVPRGYSYCASASNWPCRTCYGQVCKRRSTHIRMEIQTYRCCICFRWRHGI